MKKGSVAALVVLVAALSSIATMLAQSQVQRSTVFAWDSANTPNDWGGVRRVVRAPTPTLEELEIHVSTLDPGKSPHPPHKHEYEEILIVKRRNARDVPERDDASRRGGRDHLSVVERASQRHERRHVASHVLRHRVFGPACSTMR